MTISQEGADFLCEHEGFKPMPYQDVKGVWTIGYGTTLYPNGLKVTKTDPAVTQEQAEAFLMHHIEHRVHPELQNYNLKQHQYDALCSFIYNIGIGQWSTSTLKKDIIQGADAAKIAADFAMWVKSGGMIVPGLVKRRKNEAILYNTGNYNATV